MRTQYLEYSHISLGKKICETDTAQIYMYGNDTVAKIFPLQDSVTQMNIEIIKTVMEYETQLSRIPELVLPCELLFHNGCIVGYTMPYIKGITLGAYLHNSSFSYSEKIAILSSVGTVLKKVSELGFYFAFGDLHEENVIIDHNQIHFIDLDGVHMIDFRPISGRYIHNLSKWHFLKMKYPFIQRFPMATYNSDLFCLITIVMNWFLGGQVRFDYLRYREAKKYLRYLRRQGFSASFESMILQVYRFTRNYFDISCFPVVPPDFDCISWNSFINSPCEPKDLNTAQETLNCFFGKY